MLNLVKLCVVVQVICIILSVIMFSVTITSAVMLIGVLLSDIIAQPVATLWPVLQKYFDHHVMIIIITNDAGTMNVS